MKIKDWESKVAFMFEACAYSWTTPNTSWCQSVCMCACLSQGCLAEPETQLLALIDFSDREDFPVQGHTPSNRLRSLLAGKGVPSPWLNGTFQPVCWRAGCKKGLGVQGKGLAAPARQSFTVEEPNCTRHLQTPRNWQLSTPFLWAGLEEHIARVEIMLEAQTKGLQKLHLKFDSVSGLLFSVPTSVLFVNFLATEALKINVFSASHRCFCFTFCVLIRAYVVSFPSCSCSAPVSAEVKVQRG